MGKPGIGHDPPEGSRPQAAFADKRVAVAAGREEQEAFVAAWILEKIRAWSGLRALVRRAANLRLISRGTSMKATPIPAPSPRAPPSSAPKRRRLRREIR